MRFFIREGVDKWYRLFGLLVKVGERGFFVGEFREGCMEEESL